MQALSKNTANRGLINSSLLINPVSSLERETNLRFLVRVVREKQFVKQRIFANTVLKNLHLIFIKSILSTVRNIVANIVFVNTAWNNIRAAETENTATANNKHLYREEQRTDNDDYSAFLKSFIVTYYILFDIKTVQSPIAFCTKV